MNRGSTTQMVTPALASHQLLRILCSLLLLLVVVWPRSTLASSRNDALRQELEEAIDVFNHGGYREAAAKLTKLLYPLKLTDRKDIVRAKAFLGMSYFVLGRTEEAEEEFRSVFKLEPAYKPDPLYVPPEIIIFIERQRPLPPETPRSTAIPGLGEKVVESDVNPPKLSVANLLPLGIPQFRNGDIGRGSALAAAELGLLTLNIGSYWYLKLNNVEPNSSSDYPKLVAAKATNIASLPLFVGTLLLGAGDALYRYRTPPPPVSLHLMTDGNGRGVFFAVTGQF